MAADVVFDRWYYAKTMSGKQTRLKHYAKTMRIHILVSKIRKPQNHSELVILGAGAVKPNCPTKKIIHIKQCTSFVVYGREHVPYESELTDSQICMLTHGAAYKLQRQLAKIRRFAPTWHIRTKLIDKFIFFRRSVHM